MRHHLALCIFYCVNYLNTFLLCFKKYVVYFMAHFRRAMIFLNEGKQKKGGKTEKNERRCDLAQTVRRCPCIIAA
jgi:hypothetical protein